MELSRLQKKVISNFDRFKPGLGRKYLGALYAFDNKENPERIIQSAHSIREAIYLISRSVEIPEKQENQEDTRHKKKLMSAIDPLGGPPESLQKSYSELLKEYRWFTSVSHSRIDQPTDIQYSNRIESLNSKLLEFFKPYFEILNEIDRIIAKNTPNEKDMARIKTLVKYYQSYKYFFDKANDKWFLILKKENSFFKNAPSVRVDDMAEKIKIGPGIEGQQLVIPIWPESRYLARIANKYPKDVFGLISDCILPTDLYKINPHIIEDFIDAAIKMPYNYACKMAAFYIKDGYTCHIFRLYRKSYCS
jgi:hypothetical protein